MDQFWKPAGTNWNGCLLTKRVFTKSHRITPVCDAIAVERQIRRIARYNLNSDVLVAVIRTMPTSMRQRTYSPWGLGESLNGRGEGQDSSVKRQKELDRTLNFSPCS